MSISLSSLVRPRLVQPCLAKGTGCFQKETLWQLVLKQSSCSSLPCDAPAPGPPEQAPGAAALVSQEPLSRCCRPARGWCGRSQGALGGTGEAPAATSSVGKAQPGGSPAHGPTTRGVTGMRGDSFATEPLQTRTAVAVRQRQQRERAQRSLLPSQLPSLSVQVMVEALGILI